VFGDRTGTKRHLGPEGLDGLGGHTAQQAHVYDRSARRAVVRTQKASNNVGKVRVIKNGQLLSKPFLKLDTDTSYFRGVLGITLDPNFSSNHYVYVFYTATSPTVHNRVSRFTANGAVAVASSEKVIIELPILGTTGGHYGGSLRFATDGGLYVGVGDGVADETATNVAQSLDSLNGKILRINSDGTIPSNNPFFNSTSGNSRAIWALGVRQPYSLDVLSGTSPRMYINDVVEDGWEEIDEAAAGANYGWGFPNSPPFYEGFVASPDPTLQNYQNTVFAYAHGTTADTSCAITGGRSTTRPRCASPPSTRASTSTPTTAADG